MKVEKPSYSNSYSIEGNRAELAFLRDLCDAALRAGYEARVEASRQISFYPGQSHADQLVTLELRVRLVDQEGMAGPHETQGGETP